MYIYFLRNMLTKIKFQIVLHGNMETIYPYKFTQTQLSCSIIHAVQHSSFRAQVIN